MIETAIPKGNFPPHQKCWWSPELMTKHTKVLRLACRAYGRRSEPDDPMHQRHREARQTYGLMLKHARKHHWEGFLTSVDEK